MNAHYRIPEIPPVPEIPKGHEEAVHVPIPTVYRTEEPAWEYKHLVRRLGEEPAPDEEALNALGAEGWELAGVYTDSTSVHFYFKRQKMA